MEPRQEGVSIPLVKPLGLAGVFSIAAGAMISTGLFVLPGLAFEMIGPAAVLAYLLAGILYLPALFAQAELATAMPKAGGSYFTIERSLGAFAGTLAGFTSWLCIALKAAFACVGLGTLAVLLQPEAGEMLAKGVAVAAAVFFVGVNIAGAREAGRLQVGLVALLLGALVVYLAAALPRVESVRFVPFLEGGVRDLLAVTGMVFVSFGGLTKVVDVAEEVRDPERNLPRGLFLSFGLVLLVYVFVVGATVGVLSGDVLAGSLAPVTRGGEVALGTAGALLIGLASLLAYATTGNAGILAASRSPLAMSRDGLLPQLLSRTRPGSEAPAAAILVTGAIMVVVILFLSVADLAKTASTMFLLSFILAQISVLVQRRAALPGYRPAFRVPGHPWTEMAGIVLYLFLIADMGWVPLATAGGFIGGAAVWYVVYVQARIDRESAIVYMVKAILSRHMARSGLEDELVQITIERDRKGFDRFDRLIQEAEVLDLKERCSARDFFRQVAGCLAPKVGVGAERLNELFLEREREASTVIQPGLAIPHVVVPGEGVFAVALVRAREGIVFSELNEPVHTAFVLVGSADERNFHLKALVAIAHLVQEPLFEERWHGATNAGQLRDVALLSERKRHES